jgi:pSer/pThr/pTyr-binding forkhead associated (FHA) protein
MSRRLVVDDGRHRRELLLAGRMIVGRDPACEISHGDPRLSRRHAEFDVTAEGVRVRDLQSRNGIRVNGATVDEALLKPGDSVQIAHLVLQFVEGDAAISPPPRDRTRGDPRSTVPLGTTQPMSEDDRTRVLAASNAAARAGRVVVREGLLDERTVHAPPRSGVVPSARAAPPMVPDLADMTIRRGGTVAIAAREPGDYLGVQWLARRAWGRRVLLQGLLLALVVASVTTIPLLAWQARTFGVTAVRSVAVLAPALVAAVFAGVIVASLIARTTARGLGKER